MNKEKEIIEIIERAKSRLEKSLSFYHKNKNNKNILNHFWSNIGVEVNDVKNELMDLEIKLIEYITIENKTKEN